MNLELWAATVESVAIRGQDTSLGDVEESDAAEALLALEESYRLHPQSQSMSWMLRKAEDKVRKS